MCFSFHREQNKSNTVLRRTLPTRNNSQQINFHSLSPSPVTQAPAPALFLSPSLVSVSSLACSEELWIVGAAGSYPLPTFIEVGMKTYALKSHSNGLCARLPFLPHNHHSAGTESTQSDDKWGLELYLISRTLLDTGEQALTCARSQLGTGVTGLSLINAHQQKPGSDAFKGIGRRQSVSDSSNIATRAKVQTAKSSNEVTGCPFKAVTC